MKPTSAKKKAFFEMLQKEPRSLGEANELVLIANGPGCIARLLTGLGILLCGLLGVFTGLADLLIAVQGSETEGRVEAVEESGASVNEEEVMRIFFTYTVGSELRRSYSYSSQIIPAPGETVPVVYSKHFPHLAKVRNTSVSFWGMVGFLVCGGILAPFALWAVFGFKKLLGWRKMLVRGVPSWARMVDKKPTGTQINEQNVYLLTFEYEGPGGQKYPIEFSSHDQSQLRAVQDEEEELVVYDPDNPSKAVLWDELPIKLDLNRQGAFCKPPRKELVSALWVLAFTYLPLFFGLYKIAQIFRE